MGLSGKKVAILVEDIYQDLEVWYPLLRLKEEGATVIVVGSGRTKEFKGKYGYPIEADIDAEDLRVDDIDGVVVPGGYAPDMMRRYPAMIDIVREAFHAGKVIASICHGAWILASADIIRGKKVTCFSAIRDDVINAGARYTDEEVVVDGNIITSRKPEDLPAFLREMIKALKGM